MAEGHVHVAPVHALGVRHVALPLAVELEPAGRAAIRSQEGIGHDDAEGDQGHEQEEDSAEPDGFEGGTVQALTPNPSPRGRGESVPFPFPLGEGQGEGTPPPGVEQAHDDGNDDEARQGQQVDAAANGRAEEYADADIVFPTAPLEDANTEENGQDSKEVSEGVGRIVVRLLDIEDAERAQGRRQDSHAGIIEPPGDEEQDN